VASVAASHVSVSLSLNDFAGVFVILAIGATAAIAVQMLHALPAKRAFAAARETIHGGGKGGAAHSSKGGEAGGGGDKVGDAGLAVTLAEQAAAMSAARAAHAAADAALEAATQRLDACLRHVTHNATLQTCCATSSRRAGTRC
jgi:hypothetical protein